ncbi:MAG TPA: MFS transporter [Cellvibrionaceae bacterium]|nr:MFS transporter [Cellvibrionaceae bacterium]
MALLHPSSLAGNPRRYIIFTVFYNARAYYPVLAVLFFDLGFNLDQFVLLNLIWALTIFFCEVPSGALADTWGRRNLLVAAAVLMIIEMLCLLIAPVQGGSLLIALCVLNRLCSGLSEACASGADEALAYDSLPTENRAQAWDKILADAMRWRSAGFMLAMLLGGFLYDPSGLNKLLPSDLAIGTEAAHRLPIYLVLGQGFICLWASLTMVEPARQAAPVSLAALTRIIFASALWLWQQKLLRVLVLTGLVLDAVVRNFATLNSSYYRLIELPEWSFGVIGAGLGLAGIAVPSLAKYLNSRLSPQANINLTAICVLILLAALIPAWPLWGILPASLLMLSMGFLGFTLSKAIHQAASSDNRATVLSVKGLVFNLGYGLMSLGFSALLAKAGSDAQGQNLIMALQWQWPLIAVILAVLIMWGAWVLRHPPAKVNKV